MTYSAMSFSSPEPIATHTIHDFCLIESAVPDADNHPDRLAVYSRSRFIPFLITNLMH